MNHSEIDDSASDADEEEQINDEISTISDATAAMRVINKFLSIQTVEERVLVSFDVLDKRIHVFEISITSAEDYRLFLYQNSEHQLKYLEQGCVKIENFLSPEDVQELRKGLKEVVDNIPEEQTLTFSVYGAGKNKEADEFYLDSSDKVRYFFENDAFDSEGNLLVDKKEALNKVGYALHWWNPIFKKHTFSEKVKNLLRNFQCKDPVIVQSMLIFKKPKIGEVVKPHQDSTFLYTEPPTCIGLWFPLLEDVTLENGCLWYVPGSHKGKVHQRYVRNPAKDPLLLMEGTLPNYSDDQYVPAPAKIGDCIVIHGSVVHKSGRNTTKVPRTIYTYHVVEKDAKWSEKNWCQPTEKLPFPSMYDNGFERDYEKHINQ